MARSKCLIAIAIGLFATLLISGTAFAITTTSTGNGNWNTAATWDNGVPTAANDAVIAAGTTVTMDGAPGVCLSLTINGTADWAATTNTTDVGTGGITISATGDITGSAAGVLTSTGNLTINSTLTTTTVGITLQTTAGLTISGTGSLPVLNINTTTTNNGTITVTGTLAGSSTLTNGATGTLNIGAASVTCTLDATATGNTVTYNSTTQDQTVKATTYYHLTIDKSGKTATLGGPTTVNGNFTLTNGALSIGANTLTLNGYILSWGGSLTGGTTSNISFAGTLSGTTLPAVSGGLWNLAVNRSGATISLGAALTLNGTLTLTNGALSIGTNTLTLNGDISSTSGTLTGGTTSNISFGGTTSSTTLPAVSGGLQNLTINRSGQTITLGAALALSGDLTITAGTLDAGVFTHSIKGNWSNSGTLTAGTSTFTFNGSLTQTMSGSTFNNLTIDNSAGIILNTDETVDGVLTLTNGIVTTGVNKMIISPTGSVAWSIPTSYINGNLQKYVAGVTPIDFEIGDVNKYTPITSVTFNNVTTPGNLLANTTPGEHPDVIHSCIDSLRDVNRYWTMTDDGALAFNNYRATFNFINPGDIDVGVPPTDWNKFIVAKKNGSWTFPTVGTRTSTSTQATGMTSFSDFAIGDPWYDLDIADDLGNLVGNTMTMHLGQGNSGTGQFWLVNPNASNNVDPDPYGTGDLDSIYYVKNDLVHVTNPVAPSIPAANITVNLTPIPYSLVNGNGVLVDLTVNVPADQIEGPYETWVRVYDAMASVEDSFKLRVIIGSQEDVDIVEEEISNTAGVGDTLVLLGTFEIVNQDQTQWPWPDPDGPSNTDLYNLRFAVTHLMDSIQPTRTIPPSQIYLAVTSSGVATGPVPVDQANINELVLGDTAYVKVWVHLPYGTRAATYTGTVQVYDDDGWPTDFCGLKLWVLPSYDLDISDNTGNLVGNWMTLNNLPGTSPFGHFVLINPNNPDLNVDPDVYGNADLTTIYYVADDLVHVTNPLQYIPSANIVLSITDPHTLLSGGSENVITTVNIPADQFEGEYTSWIRVIDRATGVADSFQLKVFVGLQEDIDIVEEEISNTAGVGDTLVLLGTFEIVNQDSTQWPWPDPDGPSNADLYNLRFAVTHLMDSVQPTRTIPPSQIYLAVTSSGVATGPVPVDQANINELVLGDTAFVKVWVHLPYGTRAATYTGTVQVYDDDGWPTDFCGLKLWVLPSYDLDISDNTGNLVGNWMTLNNLPGTSPFGHFVLINPNNPDLNVDPDVYGNADLTTIYYVADDLVHVTNPLQYIPSANIVLSITDPDTLLSGGSENVITTVNIPADQFEGEYTSWIRVIDRATGVADSFQLKVFVGLQEDIDIVEEEISNTAGVGDTLVLLGTFEIVNQDSTQWPWPDPDGPSNADLYNLRFAVTHLMDSIQPTRTIPPSQIYLAVTSSGVATGPVPVDQANINELVLGDTAYVKVWVHLAYGTRAATYTGTVQVYDDDGWPTDFCGLKLWVLPSYDLDISDNEQNLVANTMILAGSLNDTLYRRFRLINPNNPDLNVDPDIYGNADLTGLTYGITALTSGSYTIPPGNVTFPGAPTTLATGGSADVTLALTIPFDQHAGVYLGKAWVTALEGPSDTFDLVVLVGSVEWFTLSGTLCDTVNHGEMATDFFMVNNIGNAAIYNFIFEATDLTDGNGHYIFDENVSFVPTNIDSIGSGDSAFVTVNVWVALGTHEGRYTGTILVKDDDGFPLQTISICVLVLPSYDLDISDNTGNLVENWMTLNNLPGTSPFGHFVLINPNNPDLNVDPDVYGNADLTTIYYVADDLVHVTNPLQYIPSANIVLSITDPYTLLSGGSENVITTVNIPADQFEGEYTSWIRVIDRATGVADSFQLKVFVGLQEDVDIVEEEISNTAGVGDTLVLLGTFEIVNQDSTQWPWPDPDGPSNADLYNLRFAVTHLMDSIQPTRTIPPSQIYLAVTSSGVATGPVPVDQANINELVLGDTAYVKVWVHLPYGTRAATYTGTVQVYDDDGWPTDFCGLKLWVLPYYDLDIADNEQSLIGNKMHLAGPMGENTQIGYFRMINPNTAELNVDPDIYGNADFTGFNLTITNLQYVPVPGADISYTIPLSAVTVVLPDSLISGDAYDASVQVAIPADVFAGTYRGTITVTGIPSSPGTPTDEFILEVVVGPVDDIDIAEASVSGTGNHGATVPTGNFTVWSTDSGVGHNPDAYDGPGNTTLYGVTFSASDLRAGDLVIPAANVSFVPAFIDSIRPGTYRTVNARVNIPFGTYATTYTGLATATNNTGTTSDTVIIVVTVNKYYDLDIADNEQSLIGNKMHLAGPMGDSTQVGYFRMINPNTAELNVDPDIYGNADFTGFNLTVTNLEYVPVSGSDISYTIPLSAVTVVLPDSLISGDAYDASVQVAIPADVFAGTYRGTITVTGIPSSPGTPTDEFILEVVVGPVDDIDITEASVRDTSNQGTIKTTKPFTVWSTDSITTPINHNPDPDGPGNTTLYGITFSSEDLRAGNLVIPAANVSFEPITIESLPPGQFRAVRANVNVPYGTYATTYSGLATATNNTGTTSDTVRIYITVNPYYDLDIADNEQSLIGNKMHLAGPMGENTQIGYFRMINPNTAELNVDPDIYGNADFTGFNLTVTNLEYVPVPGSDISYTIPLSAVTVVLPDSLISGDAYDASVQVAIPADVFAGTYRGTITVTGIPSSPGTPTDEFILEVVVGPVDDIDIAEDSVSGTGNHGATVPTGNFTVWSTDSITTPINHNPDPDGPGNTTLYGIAFSSEDLRAGDLIIPAANVSFEPITIESLPPGQSRAVRANVNVPYGTYATTYSGLATATNNTGTTSDTVRIYVTVLPSYDLDISDNTGNLVENWMNLSISPDPQVPISASGYFVLINPNTPELNVDPDMFGNADLNNIDWSVDNLIHITNPLAYIPAESVSVAISSALASGASEQVVLTVTILPAQIEGEYTGWVRVIDTVANVADSFQLRVVVGPYEDVDIVEDTIPTPPVSVGAGDTLVDIGTFTVVNPDSTYNPDPDGPSNADLYNLRFTCENFRDVSYPSRMIPESQIYLAVRGAAPTSVALATIDELILGDITYVTVWARLPYGTHTGTYRGRVQVIDDDGWPSDNVLVSFTVLPYYDLDISDNTGNLVGNWMTLSVDPEHDVLSDSAFFVEINPNTPDLNVDPDMYGNADLLSITWSIDDLLHISNPIAYIPRDSIKVAITYPDTLLSGASKYIKVMVYSPVDQIEGEYTEWLRVKDVNSGVGDSFQLRVVVGPREDVDIVEDTISNSVDAGDTLVYISRFTVVNPDASWNPDPDGPSNVDLYNLLFSAEHFRNIANPSQFIASSQIYLAVTGLFGPTPVNLASIGQLRLGDFNHVEVWANVPRGTKTATYRGSIQVQDDDGYPSDVVNVLITVLPYYDLDIADNEQSLIGNKMRLAAPMGDSTQVGYFRLINPNTAELNVDPDIYGNADFTSLDVSISDLLYFAVPGEDISYIIPSSRVYIAPLPALASGASFDGRVRVSVPYDQFAGTYRGTITVTGVPGTPGTPTDVFTLEVVVGPLDDIDIREASVSATTNHGTSVNTSTFRVYSTDAAHNPDPDGPGNTTLFGITFAAQDLRNGNLVIPSANVEFVPIMIDSIKPGDSVFVYAQVNVPFGTFATTYSGLATATNNTGTTEDTVRIFVTVNPYYDLDIADNEQNLYENTMHLSGAMGTIHQGNFRMINPNSEALNVDPDQFGNANFTSFLAASVDTLKYVPFGDEDISYVIAPSQVIVALPSNLNSGLSYDGTVTVNIPMNTFTGVYRGTVTVTGVPSLNTPTDIFTLEVVVGPVDDIDITEASVSGTGNHGTTVNTGNFTVWSTDAGTGHNPDAYDGPGNTTLYGITFSSQDLRFGNLVIPGANVSFEPITIESLPPGQSRTVQARVNIPYGVHNGLYTGLATATNNTGTTSDTVRIQITVNASYDLDIADNAQNLVGNKMTLVGNMNQLSDSAYFLLVNPNTAELNVDPDQFGNADFTGLAATITTLRYIPAPNEDIVDSIPSSSVTVTLPTTPFVSGASANGKVRVAIPSDRRAGVFRGKIWVTGTPGEPGTPTDTFILEVIVREVEDLDIDVASVSKSSGHGTTAITNSFKVYSTDALNNPDTYDGPGNTTLYGINFITSDLTLNSVQGGDRIPASNVEIIPPNIDSLRPGQSKPCSVRVFIPYGTHDGLYTGLVTAQNNTGSTSDTVRVRITVTASCDLDIADNQQNLVSNKMNLAGPMGATRQGYFRMVNPNTPEMNIDPDMYGNADFTSFTYIVDTLRYIASGNEDIITYIPPNAVTLTLPTDGLISGGSYDPLTGVTIPMNTLTGTYRGNVTVTGTPESGTPTDVFVLEVQVGMLEDLDIEQASVSTGGLQGSIVTTTPFKVWSTDADVGHNPDPDGPGNITLYGINFVASDLTLNSVQGGERVIPASNIQFTPTTIASLYPGTYESVRASVNIPYGTYTGTYSGLVTAQNNTGSTSDTVSIFLTVNPDYDLDIADNLSNLVTNKMTLNLIPNTSVSGEFLLVNPDRPENNYDPDPYGNADLTNLQYRVSEQLTSFDGFTLARSAIWFSNDSTSLYWGVSQNVTVTANIELSQHYTTYHGYVTVYKIINETQLLADSFMLEVMVGPRDVFSMPDTITIFGNAGTLADTSFFVMNTGNKTIERIELFPMTDFYSSGGVRIPMDKLQFTPPIIIDSMRVGESTEVTARVDIPRATLPTTYVAIAKAMQHSGDPAKNFVIVLNVNYQNNITEELVFSDNPVTGSYVDIACIGTDRGTSVSEKLTIMNMAAEIVRTAAEKEIINNVYRWDLNNDKGKGVASGLYVVVLQTTVNKENKVFTKKILVVK